MNSKRNVSVEPTMSEQKSFVDATPPTDTNRLTVSVDEAAEMLGISRSFAYELCARGQLPTLRLGRRLIVPRRALRELIDAAEEAFRSQR
jgi:excisionase family DNA binding protein